MNFCSTSPTVGAMASMKTEAPFWAAAVLVVVDVLKDLDLLDLAVLDGGDGEVGRVAEVAAAGGLEALVGIARNCNPHGELPLLPRRPQGRTV